MKGQGKAMDDQEMAVQGQGMAVPGQEKAVKRHLLSRFTGLTKVPCRKSAASKKETCARWISALRLQNGYSTRAEKREAIEQNCPKQKA